MKIVRLEISSRYLIDYGFDIFDEIVRFEVQNGYQYDENNFFALGKIWFSPNRGEDYYNIIQAKFQPQFFQLLEKKGDEITCILKLNRKEGFFPMLEAGPWALQFPITVDKDTVLLNLLAEENYVQQLYDSMANDSDSIKVVASINVDNPSTMLSEKGGFIAPIPDFTTRQRKIASFAAKQGYFEHPKKISAKVLAAHFQISESAVNMHLKAAENLAMKYFFGGPTEPERSNS
jgi:hypothetical protein